MIKVINESSENMEVEFAYFHPHVGMRKCSKEKAIQMVENFLNDMKNGSGYDIAGRGFAIYCTQSPDADGQMIYGRNDPDEFLSSLKESTIVESISDTISDFSSNKTTDGYEIPLSREKSFINKLSKLGYYKDDEEEDPQTHAHYVWYSNGEEEVELQYDNGEKTIIVRVSSDESKYQFTLPFSDDEDLEYQRKVAKQLGLDFEFVDEKPEYMVFRGSKELLTKYCDTYGQNSKDIEKVK